jgi:DNA-binding transcriptional regulator YdaS (Cro superfamily)
VKKSDAIAHFKTASNLARALGLTRMSVSKWGEDVPMRRAFEIECITEGALKADFTAPKQTNQY